MRVNVRPRSAQLCILSLSLSVIPACTTAPRMDFDNQATAPLLDGFGESTLLPSQANKPARRLFAQGITQMYAFNPSESIRAFKAALAQDPNCGLCAWGVAKQMGPNINNPKRGDLDLTTAKLYVDYMVKHSQGASARDRGLIESLAVRYGHGAARAIASPLGEICRSGGSGDSEPVDPLDIAYAEHMRVLATRFPADPDVLSLYAEAEMVATRGPWWDPDTGKPAGRMGELATLLEAGIARHPNHVGLNHYLIHGVDAVQVASRAVAAADRLGKLAPKSPHLLHMPAHTYALVGRYADATRVNQLAVAADDAMDLELKKQNFEISKDWRGHNLHFQWYGALMEGRGDLALETARTAAGRFRGDNEFNEILRSLPILTLLRLERWEAVAKEPMPHGGKGLEMVMGEMSRGIAMARSGQPASARSALARLEPEVTALVAKHGGKGFMAKIIRSLATTAQAQLGAELAFAEQRIDDAFALQTKAVAAAAFSENAEPPVFAGLPRLRLAEMQLEARRFEAAEQSFHEVLAKTPGSGWALHGLEKALSAQGKQAEAERARRDLATSWALADSQLRTR
ncbi:MAG: hypothetical protein JWR56_1864 [Massilia sp.]|nr:hypothetical protein [Massilia sp.]